MTRCCSSEFSEMSPLPRHGERVEMKPPEKTYAQHLSDKGLVSRRALYPESNSVKLQTRTKTELKNKQRYEQTLCH